MNHNTHDTVFSHTQGYYKYIPMKPYLVIVKVLVAITVDIGISSNHMNMFVFNFLFRFSL